jgi:para-aminobenzoate synthetase component 1
VFSGIVHEIAWRPPRDAARHFALDRWMAWFDGQGEGSRGRFSMLAVEPFKTLTGEGPDPFAELGTLMRRYRQPRSRHPIPFTGGAAGFLGYELARHLEKIPVATEGVLDIPDMGIGLYDVVLGFDSQERRAWLFSSGLPEPEGPARGARAAARAAHILRRLEAAPPDLPAPPRLAWRRETSRAEHMDRIACAQNYISAGDIYQANITARFTADRPPGSSAAAFHDALRAAIAAPFGAYLACGERLAIASVSPERFLSLSPEGGIESRPIKGTRPRGATAQLDLALRAELEASAKDRAENLMIVDLLRNDLGRVAVQGSVAVPEFCQVETFSHVHHLVSSVRASLRPGLGAVDLLRATFPGGSITGAPKIRAMEIITELERTARGPYCGAIAWLGFDGAMDSNIAIRTVVITPEVIAVQAGGGIVADSDPGEEFEEMMVKAGPLLRALGEVPP